MLVVLHIPSGTGGFLPQILRRAGKLDAVHPVEGETLQAAHIYVAPPDRHLTIDRSSMQLLRGPKENRHRPAVDPLFRSAALAWGNRAIGVILTGTLDDGSSGLRILKDLGGIAIVQDPADALYPGMPESALDVVDVDYVVPISEMVPLLIRLVSEEPPALPVDLEKRKREAQFENRKIEMQRDTIGGKGEGPIDTPSPYSCPDCNGVLWQVDDEQLRFRCTVGHAFSADTIMQAKAEELEAALWSALNTLEESTRLSRSIAKKEWGLGHDWLARRFDEKAHSAATQAQTIRDVLMRQPMFALMSGGSDEGRGESNGDGVENDERDAGQTGRGRSR